MAAVYLRPHSPPLVRGGHLHASLRQSGSFANALNTNRKNVWFGALGRGIYQGRVGWGWAGRADGAGAPCRR